MRYIQLSAWCLILVCVAVNAEDPSVTPPVFSGWGWFTMGQFVKTFDTTVSENIEGEYYVDFHAGLKMVKPVGTLSRARIHISGQIASYLDLPGQAKAEPTRWRFVPYPIDLTLESNFSLGERLSLQTEFGYFPVRYNPQARNLGEYLFRSWTYPPILISGFEMADKVKQLGFHARLATVNENFGHLQQRLVIASELDQYPTHDISIATITDYRTPNSFLDLGVGVHFSHAIPLSPERLTPGLHGDNASLWNQYSYIDTVAGDTTHYTFGGIKLMGRFTLDPKALVSSYRPAEQKTAWGRLSSEDLKLYAEVAVLGVQSYRGWYEEILERMPVMVGINIPTLGLLDVLSAEVQWYGSKYRNSPDNAWSRRLPTPYPMKWYDEKYLWEEFTEDDWKWSAYGTRTIGGILRVSLGVQSDHLQATAFHNPFPYFKFYDIVLRTKDWYWMSRISYLF